ncbi:hypothetical protein ACOSQ3_014296 [Xanthoceras sorbifolium]
MGRIHFSVRFLGSQHHFSIMNPEKYTLQTLIYDVYLLQTEIHMSWTVRYELQFSARKLDRMLVDMDLLPLATMPRVGSEYHAAEAESASSSYRTTPCQNTSTDNVVDLSSDDDDDVSEDTEDKEDEACNPVHGRWISEELDDNETYVNSDEVHVEAVEEKDMGLNNGQNAVEDEVHEDPEDPEDTQSEKDIIREDKKRSAFCARFKWMRTVRGWSTFSEFAPL